MTDGIDYGRKMHRAMRGLIRDVLEEVGREGLPGDHHFFITFDTTHPDVDLAPWLAKRYPEDMTVVMQHWFDALEVDEAGFGVTLNFGDAPERLYIPFKAIRTFVDPSVEFGLRFEEHDDEDDEDEGDGPDDDGPGGGEHDSDPPRKEAEVVSLDRFRK